MKKTNDIKSAAYINILSRYFAAFVQLCYSVILARILTPEDFGLVAIAQIFVTFFNLFADMGLGSAVVQRHDLSTLDIERLFGFSILLAFALAVLFGFAGLPISIVFEQNLLFGICCCLSATVFFSTLNTVPNALMMKQKRFIEVGLRQIISTVISSAIALVFAFLGAGYWSIVIFSTFNSLFIFSWNYFSIVLIPRFREIGLSLSKVFSYSAYLLGFNVINYFSRNLDNLLIGYFFGTANLGNYTKAYQLMTMPQTYLTSVVTPVLHPILSESQTDVDYIYSVYIKTVKILSLLGVFISVFCFFAASELIILLYGDQWVIAVPCFRLLCISVWSQMVCGTSGTMFQVLNKTKEHFVRGIVVASVVLSAVFFGVWMGSVEYVAASVGVAYYVAFFLLGPFLIKRSFNKSIVEFFKTFIPDIAIALLLIVLNLLLNSFLPGDMVISLLVRLFVNLVAYLIFVIIFRQFRWLCIALPSGFSSKLPKFIRG